MFEIKHDLVADAIYVSLDSAQYKYGRDLDEKRRIDYAANNQPIGIELLSVSKGVNLSDLPYSDIISKLLSKSGLKIYEIKPLYEYPMIGTTNVSIGISLGPDTHTDFNRIEVKKELTGVS